MCSGFSRVQIAHFIRGDESQVNVTKFYAIDPVNGKQGAGIDPSTLYLTQPLATISWVAGTRLGLAAGGLNVLDRFSDGVVVTLIAAVAHDLFQHGAPPLTGAEEYNSILNDIGFATLALPACWGFLTTWKTDAGANTTASNHLLKFS